MGAFINGEETSIYIVDRNYRIVHFNKVLQKVFPKIKNGDICYEQLCGEANPCRECPLAKKQNDSTIFYNKMLQQWVQVNTGELEWPGAGECSIISCREIHEGNKNLFYNLTHISTYDELFELNLSRDIYRILYHMKDKYVIPAMEGKLSFMVQDVVEHMIHPDDRRAFLEFWNMDTLIPRLMHGGNNNTLKGQFRKKRINGEFCWVVQTVVLLRYGEYDDKIVMCFIQDINDQKMKEMQKEIQPDSALDPMTGLYRRTVFFQSAETFLSGSLPGQYCLMAIDIEHFKLFNEWYGQEEGDRFLINIGRHLKTAQQENGGIAGYMGGDDFVIILPREEKKISKLQERIIGYVKQYGGNAGFLPAFGMYEIGDSSVPVSIMYDRASIALASVKGNYAKRVSWYDSRMKQKMEDDHMLLTEVQRALSSHEFTFYAQPKCNMATGKIVGLESLVRWNHPERGLIPPGEFIPLLESNGFIAELDLYIWDMVCSRLKNWIDKGHRAVPISVNVSRVDIYSMDIVECFKGLTAKYGLEPRLLEIEITESAYVEEYGIIPSVVDELRKAGFAVLMDDFGSGYSSLNMLKDVNVDVLKLDIKFLEMNEQSVGKGMGILEAITSMARMIGLKLIAEGVETREQIDLLLDMGCLYGQGYYFYRPMPIDVFEPLLADENNVDYRGIKAKKIERLKLKDLLNDDIISESMINNILGAVAFYRVSGKRVELLRVNEQYYKLTGTDPVSLEERRLCILDDICEEDDQKLLSIFDEAYREVLHGAEGDVRRIKGDGSISWMHLRAFFLKEQDDYRIYYGSVSDVTVQKQKEQQLKSSQKELAAVVHLSENDSSFMKLTEENRKAAASIFSQMTPGGMIGGYCEAGFPLYFVNQEMLDLLQYDSYDEFSASIRGLVINTIHPDDRERVANDIGPDYYPGLEYTTTYRMPRKDGSWFWTLDKGKVVMAEDGRMAIVSACTDISENMMMQQQLTQRNEMLSRQNQELYFLNNDMPGGYHRCAVSDGYDFIYVSNRFLNIFGYTREEIKELFDDKFVNMIHPDDRSMVAENVQDLKTGREPFNMEYRMKSKNGYIWVIDQSRYLEYEGRVFLQGVVLDVTETVELRNKMKLIMDYTPEDIYILNIEPDKVKHEVVACGLFRQVGYSFGDYEKMLDHRLYTEFVSRSDLLRIERLMAKAVEERRNYYDTIRMELPDGKPAWVRLNVRFVKETNEGVMYLCIASDITTGEEQARELLASEKKIESILRQAHINGWDWDIRKRTLTLNYSTVFASLTLLSEEEDATTVTLENFPEQAPMDLLVEASHLDEYLAFLERVRSNENHGCTSCEFPVPTKNNQLTWIRVSCETLCDDTGHAVRAVGYFTDITGRKKEEAMQRENMKTLELLCQQAVYDFKVRVHENIMRNDKDGGKWLQDTKCHPEWSYDKTLDYMAENLVLPEHREAFLKFFSRDNMLRNYRDGVLSGSLEYQRLSGGKPKWLRGEMHVVKFEGSDDILAYIFILDIDEQKTQELQLTKRAETDSLTGLYNRQTAVPKIKQYLESLKDETAALIMFDLDNFKAANDVFGHAYGDTMISENANKLKRFFRENDIVCRIGGDEFLVLCKNIRAEYMERKLEEVVNSMISVRRSGGQEMVFSISAGYVMTPEQGTSFDDLYRKADIALFTAKMDGKKSYKKYDPSMKSVRYELAEGKVFGE